MKYPLNIPVFYLIKPILLLNMPERYLNELVCLLNIPERYLNESEFKIPDIYISFTPQIHWQNGNNML